MEEKPSVIVYTHPGCPGGDHALSFFSSRGIPVIVKDILHDLEARKEFHQRGCFATPVLIIDGRNYAGFEEDEIQKVLNEKRTR